MHKQISLFLKKDDSIKAKKFENADGQYLSIEIDDIIIYFDGYGKEGYEEALAYLDDMEKEIRKVWNEKGE